MRQRFFFYQSDIKSLELNATGLNFPLLLLSERIIHEVAFPGLYGAVVVFYKKNFCMPFCSHTSKTTCLNLTGIFYILPVALASTSHIW